MKKGRQALSKADVLIGKGAEILRKGRSLGTHPLLGKKIVVTRASGQAPEFVHLLEEAGADVILLPTIEIVPPPTWAPVDRALGHLSAFDWILFTSVNGVAMFFNRMKEMGRKLSELEGIRIGAIGPKTSARLEALGLKVDIFPEDYRAEALADALGKVRAQRVLIARAQEARDVLPNTLRRRGAKVTIATVYRTLKPQRLAQDLRQRFSVGDIDLVTFTSSSTVDGFMRHWSAPERKKVFQHMKAAVIGPITAETLRGYGVRPTIRASRYTIEALAHAIMKHYAKREERKAKNQKVPL